MEQMKLFDFKMWFLKDQEREWLIAYIASEHTTDWHALAESLQVEII